MKDIVLNGFIGDKYGTNWRIKADRVTDIFACIEANYPEFRKDIVDFAVDGGDVSITCGTRDIDVEDLLFSVPEDTIIITPIPAGAKGGGAKILLGALLIASLFIPGSAALLTTAAFGTATGGMSVVGLAAAGGMGAGMYGISTLGYIVIGLGASLAVTGLTQLMAPDISNEGPGEDKYLFNGPENTTPQNSVVPVLLGELIVGGVIIASGTVSGLKNRSATFIVGGTGGTTGTGGATDPGTNSGPGDINTLGGGGVNRTPTER